MTSNRHNGKIIAIHQPNFFPWLGYFHKIYHSDVFVFHDNAEYSKKAYINRTFVRKAPNSPERAYITLPLKKHSDFERIKNLKVDNSQNFHQKLLNRIRNVYQKTPFFGEYFPLVEETILNSGNLESLLKINMGTIECILKILSIKREFVFSSSLPVNGKKSEYNLNVVKHLKGAAYFSGSGAREYQNDADFDREGIRLVYQDIYDFLEGHPYEQFQEKKFLNGLSIIDALFNVGASGITEIFKSYEKAMSEKQGRVKK